jgi:hypothetical protein
LWAQGKEDAAIQRERLWDELAKTGDIEVRCGCVLGTFDYEQEKDIVEKICAEHSAVSLVDENECSLPS